MVQSFDNRDLGGGGQSGLPANLDIILPADDDVKRGDVVGAISGKVYKCAPGKTFAQVGPSYENAIEQIEYTLSTANTKNTCLKTFSDGKSLVLHSRSYFRILYNSDDYLCIYDESGIKLNFKTLNETIILGRGGYSNNSNYIAVVPSHTTDEFLTIIPGYGQSSLSYSSYIISRWNSDLEVLSTFEIDSGVQNELTYQLQLCNFIWSNDRLFCMAMNTAYYLKVFTVDTLNEAIVTDIYMPTGMNYSVGTGIDRQSTPGPIWLDDAKTKFAFVYFYHSSNTEDILITYDLVTETIVTKSMYHGQSSYLSYAKYFTNTVTHNNSDFYVDVDTSCGYKISDTRIVYLARYNNTTCRIVISDIDLDTMVETIVHEVTIGSHSNSQTSANWIDGDYLYYVHTSSYNVYGSCINVVNGTTEYLNTLLGTVPDTSYDGCNYLDMENKKYYMFIGTSVTSTTSNHNYNMLIFEYSPLRISFKYVVPPERLNSDITLFDYGRLLQGVRLGNKIVYIFGNYSNGSTVYSDGVIIIFYLDSDEFEDVSDYINTTYADNPHPYVYREAAVTSSYPSSNQSYAGTLQSLYGVLLDVTSFKLFNTGFDESETYNTMYKVFSKEFKVTDIPIIGVALTDAPGGNVKVRINGYTRLNDDYKNIWKEVDHTNIDGGKIRVMSTHAIIGE